MVCYLCLEKKDEQLPIFENETEMEWSIAEMIEKYLNVKPIQMENGRCEMCVPCWQKLIDFHEYYQNIQALEESRVLLVEGARNLDEYTSNIIKEECVDVSPYSNTISDAFETEDPFLDLEDEEYKPSNAKTRKRKSRKRSSTLNSNEEEMETPLNDIKNEVDVNTFTTAKTGGALNKGAETKRRKGRVLLEENEELIKKHIQMLCQICTHSSNEFQDLMKHYKEEHPEVKPHIKCCERKLECPSDILQHAYYHENPEHFKCNECGRTFINKSALRDHYKQYHEPEENLPFACDVCPRRFCRKNLLEHHKSKHVPVKERSHYCEICNPPRTFANEYTLQVHIKNRHTKATNICHVCAKEIRDKQAFEKHVRQHFETSGPRIKCPREDCDSWLKDHDSVKQHLKRTHNATGQCECPHCGRICKRTYGRTYWRTSV
ncbi:transcription factor grauzone isoform X2 [Stomoxys calcitrans]|uniref:transcription factor grauzone isoform X2 n=1 Tax=Stomoxys calcitrans TaxID=35570 RepID=UPI0027E3100D|nr:transcription factor grauzone isoform X2 [Stomoxys calcitrans]